MTFEIRMGLTKHEQLSRFNLHACKGAPAYHKGEVDISIRIRHTHFDKAATWPNARYHQKAKEHLMMN